MKKKTKERLGLTAEALIKTSVWVQTPSLCLGRWRGLQSRLQPLNDGCQLSQRLTQPPRPAFI